MKLWKICAKWKIYLQKSQMLNLQIQFRAQMHNLVQEFDHLWRSFVEIIIELTYS